MPFQVEELVVPSKTTTQGKREFNQTWPYLCTFEFKFIFF